MTGGTQAQSVNWSHLAPCRESTSKVCHGRMPHCGKKHIGRSKKTWEQQKKICERGGHFDVRVLKLIIID